MTQSGAVEREQVDVGALCAVLSVELGDGTWCWNFISFEPRQACRNIVDRMVDQHWRYLLGCGTAFYQGHVREVVRGYGANAGVDAQGFSSKLVSFLRAGLREGMDVVDAEDEPRGSPKVVTWMGSVVTPEQFKRERRVEEALRKASGAKAVDFLWWKE